MQGYIVRASRGQCSGHWSTLHYVFFIFFSFQLYWNVKMDITGSVLHKLLSNEEKCLQSVFSPTTQHPGTLLHCDWAHSACFWCFIAPSVNDPKDVLPGDTMHYRILYSLGQCFSPGVPRHKTLFTLNQRQMKRLWCEVGALVMGIFWCDGGWRLYGD